MWELWLQKKTWKKCSSQQYTEVTKYPQCPRMTGFSGWLSSSHLHRLKTAFSLLLLPKQKMEKNSQGYLLILTRPWLNDLESYHLLVCFWIFSLDDLLSVIFFLEAYFYPNGTPWLNGFQVSRAKSFSSRCGTVWKGRTVRCWLVMIGIIRGAVGYIKINTKVKRGRKR